MTEGLVFHSVLVTLSNHGFFSSLRNDYKKRRFLYFLSLHGWLLSRWGIAVVLKIIMSFWSFCSVDKECLFFSVSVDHRRRSKKKKGEDILDA